MRGTIRARARTDHALRGRVDLRASLRRRGEPSSSRDRWSPALHEPPARPAPGREPRHAFALALSATISAAEPRAPRAWGAPLAPAPAARSLAPRPRSPRPPRRPPRRFLRRPVRRRGDHAARGRRAHRPPGRSRMPAATSKWTRARPRRRGGRRALERRARAVRADLESARGTDAAVVAAAERRAEELARVLDGTELELRRVRETFRRERDAVTRDLERARAAAADRDSKVMDAVRQRDDARRVADERVASLERAREDRDARRPPPTDETRAEARDRRQGTRTRRERTRTRGERARRGARRARRGARRASRGARLREARGGRTTATSAPRPRLRSRRVCAWRRSRRNATTTRDGSRTREGHRAPRRGDFRETRHRDETQGERPGVAARTRSRAKWCDAMAEERTRDARGASRGTRSTRSRGGRTTGEPRRRARGAGARDEGGADARGGTRRGDDTSRTTRSRVGRARPGTSSAPREDETIATPRWTSDSRNAITRGAWRTSVSRNATTRGTWRTNAVRRWNARSPRLPRRRRTWRRASRNATGAEDGGTARRATVVASRGTRPREARGGRTPSFSRRRRRRRRRRRATRRRRRITSSRARENATRRGRWWNGATPNSRCVSRNATTR